MTAATNLEPNHLAFDCHDAANAERIVAQYGDRLRYCHAMRKWHHYDGTRWSPDVNETALRLAKDTMARFLGQAINRGKDGADHAKWGIRSLDARRLQSALQLAQSELPIAPEAMDADPDLLNFANCTVHLPTLTLRPHRAKDYITRVVPFRFEASAAAPVFRAFLDRIMGVHSGASAAELTRAFALVDYLRIAFGYSVTGWTREKCIFVPFGTGDNGKTTLLSTVQRLISEYSATIQADSLMSRSEGNNQQADLADLRGARFVVTSETEQGQYLSQARLKRITQGMGQIRAVRKYENPITFPETHKLWMDTNRRPRIRDVEDKATFNRLHPIPFCVTIPKSEQDSTLPTKLFSEAEGILAWIAEGARLWYAHGLERPADVEAAREAWKAEDDQVGRYLEERCVVGGEYQERAGELFKDYRRWCEESGEKTTLSASRLKSRLEQKGVVHREGKSGNSYFGVRVRGYE